MEYLNANQGVFWLGLGFLMIVLEVLVFGFTTMLLVFGGLGALTTGILMQIGILPNDWIWGFGAFGVFTAVYTKALWKTLLRLQNDSRQTTQTSDMIGLDFVTEQEITLLQPGTTRYSGVNWKVEIDKSAGTNTIPAGTRVEVVSLDAGLFRVKPH
ncbi:MAG: hypothetical protein OEZ39_15180 [Gammaproteobacteria bacterium]|nr:hypothetical protein [Gammaproteobacteria bacterium]MDH5653197.1 hypothetical protein [Gammaproteobacteria bacterium]